MGDLILEVDHQLIENVEGLRQQMEKISAGKQAVVVMKVLRGVHSSFLEIEPPWKN